MKLLVVTQTVDVNDPVLGFFHEWIVGLAERLETVTVICLYEGAHELPDNVRVHSLGKERGRRSRSSYALRFLALAWRLRKDYDTAFVHMNQEYVLLGGVLWKALSKRMYIWRNHYAGSLLTDLAAALCTKVFCTSKHSYTAKYRRTVLMPVGVDTRLFTPDPNVVRKPASVLFLSRMTPAKRPEMLLEALRTLSREGIAFSATFVGSPLPEHVTYYERLRDIAETEGLDGKVLFLPGVAKADAPDLYRAHQVFVNCSPSGMLDKTLFEATACGCTALASSEDFRELAGEQQYFDSAEALSAALKSAFETPTTGSQRMAEIAHAHSLRATMDKLAEQII
jgi:glycosyltransferase involved in cell wall biosynthesis